MRTLVARVVVGVVGLGCIAFGVRGIFTHPADTHPQRWATWLIGGAVGHDLLLAPALAVIGYVVGRFVPPAARAVVQTGLIVTGAVLAVGLVGVFGRGKRNYPDNGSLLPLPYARNLLLVLAAVWVVTLVAAGVAVVRQRGKHRLGAKRAG